MTAKEQAVAARKFAAEWQGHGDEKSETSKFWMTLLSQVYGISEPYKYIDFEKTVKVDGSVKFIDAYIPSVKVLIEQKSADIKLDKAYHQSGGAELTPYGQAKRYDDNLPFNERARWIIACNFQSFLIYDMNKPGQPPQELLLENLHKEYYRLNFLVDESHTRTAREFEISLEAGDIVRSLYEKLLPRYLDPNSPETLKSLNKLCVRIVFCLYAEDAGLFGKHSAFHDYLQQFEPKHLRNALLELFRTLDTPSDKRDPYADEALNAFPYVNGGLFADENIEIPQFDEELKTLLLSRASDDFDWSAISPTIFGAVFESTLNPETRRGGGMHYTSIENIHKVIDPLFLDSLKAELADAMATAVLPARKKRLQEFIDHIASLVFLDPACGSGNFLTETFLSLRRLENAALMALNQGQMQLDIEHNIVKVSIHQFHGIEINDFAVAVARTALWIAESQMFNETQEIIHSSMDFLPLKSYDGIAEGNALRMDWNSVVPKERLNYIIGNPPFIGYSLQSKEQKEDMLSVIVDEKGKPYKTAGKVDYVAGWYYKAAELMQGTAIRAALVSTNSITQGEQVAAIWKPLMERFGLHIDFAHRTFRWDSEAAIKAHVHCVIIGFSCAPNDAQPVIFDGEKRTVATHISPYLIDAEDIFIEARSRSISNAPQLLNGGKPTEGGFLILSEEECDELLKKAPLASKLLRPYMMGKDFLDRKPRYCLWLVNASPSVVHQCPAVMQRIDKVREYRLASPKEATRKKAETPMLFDEIRECLTDYVAIPKVSSERRKYIPIDYLSAEIIPGDKIFMLPSATLYHFGVLTSLVHNAWMRVITGRLKSDYSYSINIVYNNFPWPEATEEQKRRIEETAQGILDARALYPDSSLADLYDELTMPSELRKAHQKNDHAVMDAYGYPHALSEPELVADLFRRYSTLVG